MAFGGRGPSSGRGGRGGRGGGGRGGGRGGGSRQNFDQGPPAEVIELGHFTHCCENDIVCNTTCGKIPYFNAPVYFENKEQIGKIDEIFGGPRDNGFSVKLSDGLKASSFKSDQKIYIDSGKLLPLERFLDGGQQQRGRGQRGRGQQRGGRGGGGRGSAGGGGRGGFSGSAGRGANQGRDRGGFRGRARGESYAGRGGNRGGAGFQGGTGFGFRGGGANRGGQGQKRSFNDSGSKGMGKKMKFDE